MFGATVARKGEGLLLAESVESEAVQQVYLTQAMMTTAMEARRQVALTTACNENNETFFTAYWLYFRQRASEFNRMVYTAKLNKQNVSESTIYVYYL